MARPRSEDKRNAILAAAAQVIAEQGIGAPTARIARLAGVAEGTLFTYFDTKDELLNQLYLEIKAELREAMMATYPKTARGTSGRSTWIGALPSQQSAARWHNWPCPTAFRSMQG